jgi:hypothetical protein
LVVVLSSTGLATQVSSVGSGCSSTVCPSTSAVAPSGPSVAGPKVPSLDDEALRLEAVEVLGRVRDRGVAVQQHRPDARGP